MTPAEFSDCATFYHAELLLRAAQTGEDVDPWAVTGIAATGALLASYAERFHRLSDEERAHHARLTQAMGDALAAVGDLAKGTRLARMHEHAVGHMAYYFAYAEAA